MRRTVFGLIMLVGLGLLALTSSTPSFADGPLGTASAMSAGMTFGQVPAGTAGSTLAAPVNWYGVPLKGPLGATEVKALPAPPQTTNLLDNQLQTNLAKVKADAASKGMKVQDVSTAGLDAGKALKKSLTDNQRQAISKSFGQQQKALETALAPVRAVSSSQVKAGAASSLAAAQDLSNSLKGVQAALDTDIEKVLTPEQLTLYHASQPKAPELNMMSNANVAKLGLKSLSGGALPAMTSASTNAYYAYLYSYYSYVNNYNGYVYAYYGYVYGSHDTYDYYSYVYNYYAYINANYAYIYDYDAYAYYPNSTYAYYGYLYSYNAYNYSYYGYLYAYYALYYLTDSYGYFYYSYLYNYYGYYYSYPAYVYSIYGYNDTQTSSTRVVSTQNQGFDSCSLPTTSQMQTWWTYSPYYWHGLYIGGSNVCHASGAYLGTLTSSWVSTVRGQGWKFVPIWVGPQAYCTTHSDYGKMSSDSTTAYNQGRSEADSAANAAKNLGLTASGTGGTIIYYDMEAFPYDQTCRNVTASFMSGWVGRMHELGSKAGGYGSSDASHLSDWWTISNKPDDVWPGDWGGSSYNSSQTVFGAGGLSDSFWSSHQRLGQYTAGHNETWGTSGNQVTLSIDSDAADGDVVN